MKRIPLLFALFVPASAAANTVASVATDEEPRAFAMSYAGLEFTRNYPIAFSEDEFSPGKTHLALSFRYFPDQDWMMGLAGGFRMLRAHSDVSSDLTGDTADTQSDSKELPVFTIAHESARIIRIYHPVYLTLGARILYLAPTRQAMIPTGKSEKYQTEFGAGLVGTVIWQTGTDRFWTLRAERWRGTGSQRYHGVEIAFGGGMSFD